MENEKKGINDPKLLELHSHREKTIWVGELASTGFKYAHVQKGEGAEGEWGRRGSEGEEGEQEEVPPP